MFGFIFSFQLKSDQIGKDKPLIETLIYSGVYKHHYKSWVLKGPIVAFISTAIGFVS